MAQVNASPSHIYLCALVRDLWCEPSTYSYSLCGQGFTWGMNKNAGSIFNPGRGCTKVAAPASTTAVTDGASCAYTKN